MQPMEDDSLPFGANLPLIFRVFLIAATAFVFREAIIINSPKKNLHPYQPNLCKQKHKNLLPPKKKTFTLTNRTFANKNIKTCSPPKKKLHPYQPNLWKNIPIKTSPAPAKSRLSLNQQLQLSLPTKLKFPFQAERKDLRMPIGLVRPAVFGSRFFLGGQQQPTQQNAVEKKTTTQPPWDLRLLDIWIFFTKLAV